MTTEKPRSPAAPAAASDTTSDLAGQMADRRRITAELRDSGTNPFANDAVVSHPIYALPGEKPEEVAALPLDSEVQPEAAVYAVAGRLLQVIDMG